MAGLSKCEQIGEFIPYRNDRIRDSGRRSLDRHGGCAGEARSIIVASCKEHPNNVGVHLGRDIKLMIEIALPIPYIGCVWLPGWDSVCSPLRSHVFV